MAASRLMDENGSLFSHAELQIQLHGQAGATHPPIAAAVPHETALQEAVTSYNVRKL
jgi:hypothetical protein